MIELAVYAMVFIYFVVLVVAVGIFIWSVRQDKINEDIRVRNMEVSDARKHID
jgi:hypothetical protein